MDINQIRELVRIAEESGVSEIAVEEEGMRVEIRMSSSAPIAAAPAVVAPAVAPQAVPVTATQSTPEPSAAAPAEPEGHPSSWKPVIAPMVGTYYEAPGPGEPPFVNVGDEVSAGQTLCIIEAMKLMNEIGADEIGTVREVCLEDGAPVEYGTVLFYVEPHGAAGAAPESA